MGKSPVTTSQNQDSVLEVLNLPELPDFINEDVFYDYLNDTFWLKQKPLTASSLLRDIISSSTDDKHNNDDDDNVVFNELKRNFTRGPEDTMDMKILNSIIQTIQNIPLNNKTE